MATRQATRKPVDSDWHKAEIKAALEKADWTIRALAKHHAVSHTAVGRGLTRKSPISEQRIAEAIGVPPAEIWPSRYAVRVKSKPARNGSTAPRRGHVHKSRAR